MPPVATVARKNRASFCMAMPFITASRRVRLFGGVERNREALFLAVIAGALPEARPADAGRTMLADQVALLVLAQEVVDEQVLGDDHVAFETHHLGDVRDLARAVAQARRLDDDVDRG